MKTYLILREDENYFKVAQHASSHLNLNLDFTQKRFTSFRSKFPCPLIVKFARILDPRILALSLAGVFLEKHVNCAVVCELFSGINNLISNRKNIYLSSSIVYQRHAWS